MKIALSKKIVRVIKNKKKLQEEFNVEINIKDKEVTVTGSPENEYMAIQAIEALDLGFPYSDSLLVKNEVILLEKINIKDHTKKTDLPRIRGRIIGKNGKALKTLSELTDCSIELKDNTIGIIGETENIEKATKAIISIIQGAKHSATYKYLEKNQSEPIYDLGLKQEFSHNKKL